MSHDRVELQVIKEAHFLFRVIDQRYKDNKSLIFTTNIEEPDWPELLGDPICTSAILDRILHHYVIVRIKGSSYRNHKGTSRKSMPKRKQGMQNQFNIKKSLIDVAVFEISDVRAAIDSAIFGSVSSPNVFIVPSVSLRSSFFEPRPSFIKMY